MDPERSTQTSTTYLEPDGSYRLEASLDAVNFLDDDGDWQVIDNDLVEAPGSTYAVENAENDFTAQMPVDASAAPVRITSDEGTISMRLNGLDADPDVEGSIATYDDVADASEVTYEVIGAGVKENIVLDQAPAAGAVPLSYVYTIQLSPGLSPRLLTDGSVQIRKMDGGTAFLIPAGNMTDSAAPDLAFSAAVEYDLTQAGSAWELTVTPDMRWLRDPARVYPVRIDPSVLTKSIQRNCWLDQANPTTNGCGVNASYLRVGRRDQVRRTILDFDTTAIPSSADLNAAELNVYLYASQGTSNTTANYGLHRPDRAWNNTATWNTSGASGGWLGGNPGAQSVGSSLSIYGPTSGLRKFNAFSFVGNWKSGNWARTGIMIRSENESTATTDIAFASGGHPTASSRPELVVSYTEAGTSPPVLDETVSAPEPAFLPDGRSADGMTDADREAAILEFWTQERIQASSEATTMPPEPQEPVVDPGDPGADANFGQELDVAGDVPPAAEGGAEEPLARAGEPIGFGSTTGKVKSSWPDGSIQECSGAVVNSSSKSLVITAGHCIYDKARGGWATSAIFIHGYYNGNFDPRNSFAARNKITFNEWINHGGSARGYNSDVGFLVMRPNARTKQKIVDRLGGNGLTVGGSKEFYTTLFGYPESRSDAQIEQGCRRTSTEHRIGTFTRWYYPKVSGCGWGKGSSGGAWLHKYNNTTKRGHVRSVTSFVSSNLSYLGGPYFRRGVENLWKDANTL